MAEKSGIYRCEICGNVVEVLDANAGELVCCGKPMQLMETKTQEQEGKEKHVPVLEVEGNKVTVKVGSVEHPMGENHYIQLIEVMHGDEVVASYRPSPGEKPEATWELEVTEGLWARELCNVHGLWKN